ncbi:MAG: ABC-F family ATPase [Calditrichaeota bacterium]|nr:MAG: ABC-F family ATPase [Calditrichota bacterium]
MIATSNLTMQFGGRTLFENVSVKFTEGNRYGLIGANGSGKSTLMKILSGDMKPTSGTVVISENDRLGVLKQDQFAFEKYSVIDTVIMGNLKLWNVKKERDRIYALPNMSEEDGIKVADLEMEFAEMDGYTAESRAGELLLGLEIPVEQHEGPMSAVAPGWKLRVLLAQALFSNPEILLLDEPTNNLDINAIRWLEEIITRMNSIMIIISHDRHFLNSVCTHMADLDYGELRMFPGNYDEYMTAASQAKARIQQENSKKKAQIAELQAFVSRFSANASKARQATSRQNQLDKIQLEEVKPSSRVYPYIRFDQEKKLFRVILETTGLTKGYESDAPLFNNLNMLFSAGEKVAIIGQNGVGKTTFLRCLMNQLKPDTGTIKWSDNAKIGYMAQDTAAEFEEDTNLFDWITRWKKPDDDEQKVRSVLGRLLFSQHEIDKSTKVISGGEKGRMMFGKLMMQLPNILILDEPTNHLDMESIESLNTALELYPGTVFFVSHDREFVSSIATRIIEIRNDEVIDFTGNYEDYLLRQGEGVLV